MAIDSDVVVLPGPAQNADVTYAVATEAQLTWDAGLSPAGDIQSYNVFYKESATPDYPLTPQITRTDMIPGYTETINVPAGIAYDFIVRTRAYTGLVSSDDCTSCEVLNSKACGDGIIITGEECDGTNLNAKTCRDFGFNSGTLRCSDVCTYSYSSCYNSSGGENISERDITPPFPGTATSPEYAGTSPIIVTYSGAYDTGGSGFAYVELWYKKGTGSWMNSGLTNSATSGSFNFIPDSSLNATYYFDLVAWDQGSNSSAYPSGSGDDSTIYDAQKPTIGSVTVPPGVATLPINISYANAVDVGISGLKQVELWYKIGEAGTWVSSGLTKTTASGTFNFSGATASGKYYFDVIAVDRAGNRSIEDQETLIPVIYDIDPPTLGGIMVDAAVTGGPITIAYNGAVDVGPAGLKKVELWYKKELTGTWTNSTLTKTTADGSFSFVPMALFGNYYFSLVLEDNMGNRSAPPADQGMATVVYSAGQFAATLSTLPAKTTDQTSANITVGGANIVSYQYKLDAGSYSAETPVAQRIVLNNLNLGTHSLSVIGKNSLGQWQATSAPTTYQWTVIAPPPKPTAVLSTLPALETELRTASITVGGPTVVSYRFKLDTGTYSAEIPIATKINLANLALGDHTISVIGKSDAGVWQLETTPTTYSWTVLVPPPPPEQEVTAEEGEGDEEEQPPAETTQPPAETTQPPAEEEQPPAEEEYVPTADEVEEVLLDGSIPHCENDVMDHDEENINCGGTECPICIDVNFDVTAKPLGRKPNEYQSMGKLNLFSILSGKTIRTTDITFSSAGSLDFLYEQIPANTYHVGVKGTGYLQKIIRDVPLNVNNMNTILDFTLGGTFYLIGGDLYNDNIINSFDLALLLNNYFKTTDYLDLNQDGLVNAADLATILSRYQMKGDTP